MRSPGLGRRLPPLVMGALALALMIAILPSSLHLPITGPGSQAEVAPVPGQGNTQANLSQLGLADSGTVGGGGGSAVGDALQATPPAEAQLLQGLGIKGGVAQQARCIGNPARQTEDPLSPPCVASWQGDNGGSTYKGVSGNVVTIVIVDTQYGHDDRDYTGPLQANDSGYDLTARVLLRYFQTRFQTYGRRVRIVNYRGSGMQTGGNTNLTYEELKQRYNPFAIIPFQVDRSMSEKALLDHVMV
ncbi:MAG: hypothetical protein ACYDGR_14650, partial [Candidatus Dormibacteria bacterium]